MAYTKKIIETVNIWVENMTFYIWQCTSATGLSKCWFFWIYMTNKNFNSKIL